MWGFEPVCGDQIPVCGDHFSIDCDHFFAVTPLLCSCFDPDEKINPPINWPVELPTSWSKKISSSPKTVEVYMSTDKASRVSVLLHGPNQSLPVWIFLILKMQKIGLSHSYLPCWARPKSSPTRWAIDKNVTETVVGITLSMSLYGGDSQSAMLSTYMGIMRLYMGIVRQLMGIISHSSLISSKVINKKKQ